jgi:hypothetical protein
MDSRAGRENCGHYLKQEKEMQSLQTIATRTMLTGLAFVTLAAAGSVPFTGRDMGTFTSSPTAHQQVVLTKDSASGEATHLGRYTLSAQESINLANLDVTGGVFTITDANGDKLTGEYSGKAFTTDTPTIIRYEVSGPIIGGTGRFADAHGIIAFFGLADLQSGRLSETFLALRELHEDER